MVGFPLILVPFDNSSVALNGLFLFSHLRKSDCHAYVMFRFLYFPSHIDALLVAFD